MNVNSDETKTSPSHAPQASRELEPTGVDAKKDTPPRSRLLHRTAQAIPTLLVMGLLSAVGYFGHHYGWKVPKFSELTGRQAEPGVQWCEEHGVPDANSSQPTASTPPKVDD